MGIYKKLFLYHNLKLEIYGTIIISPLGIYFVIIAGRYKDELTNTLIIGAILAIVFTIALGILARVYKLYPIIKKMGNERDTDHKDINFKNIKVTLINYPYFEAILITLRWIFGAALTNLFLYLMTGRYETTIYFLSVTFLAPANFTLYYFATENNISKLLFNKRLVQEYLPQGSYIKTSIFIKTLMIIISISMILIIILGYFLYQTNENIFLLKNITHHLLYISLQSSVVIFFFAYEATSNMKRSLKLQLENLEKLKKGELDISQPMFASDEINIAGQYLNILAASMKNYSKKNKELTDSLEEKVESRTQELSAAMEEMEAMNDELLDARDQLWSEIQVAQKIQDTLLPINPHVNNYEIITYMDSATSVGGDYYDIINNDKNNWVMIGDVSGHGVSAGLIMMMAQTAIRTIIMDDPEIIPSSLLEKVDRAISHNIKHMQEKKFMTISALSFGNNGEILCSGRHEDILIYRSHTKSVEVFPTDGICFSPWGLGKKDKNITLTLKKNDILFLYTDGITEARDNDGDLFGMERLISIFQCNGEESLEKVRDNILLGLDSYEKNDDITIVLLKKK